jgi:tetratricopeptide (TPR) repeat protein
MENALADLTRIRRLADSGRHAAVVQELEQRPADELVRSATLALLYGTAQARLGRLADASHWVDVALSRARRRGDRAIELRALNARGAIALEGGRLPEAAEYFMRALDRAQVDGDHAAVGRCSNNLGIIAHHQGRYEDAIGRYTLGAAAFQQAHLDRGIAECHHNLAITYRERKEYLHALKAADRAVTQAAAAGDAALAAATLAGRAEVRRLSGDAPVAVREVRRALEMHRELGDVVGECEDLRIIAGCHADTGLFDEAEAEFRQVIERADQYDRPAIAAGAERDLARLLCMRGRTSEGVEAARRARVRFQELGFVMELERLDALASEAAGAVHR